jgi:methylglutaconyl-CoA hydratase
MSYQHLLVRREGPVEHLRLNRPDVRNALNDRVLAELSDWSSSVVRGARPRVVILEGAGKSFCAGADVDWMAQTIEYSPEENLRDATAMSRTFAALDELPIPVVGRIHGAALGGGAGLAAICDIVVSEDEALFGFTEVKLGIVPAVISPFVLAKIGRAAARELFLTGARFSAARAREIGLVHTVVPPAQLDDAVVGHVGELLSAGPEAIATAKALIRQVTGQSAGNASSLTTRTIAERRVSAEGQEGLRAFLEKRTPRWVIE